MNIKHILTLIIAINLAFSSSVTAEEVKDQTLFFYNTTDMAGAIPFMSISFLGIPEEEAKNTIKWREEIQEKLVQMGGIFNDEDYKKISEVIPDYVVKFLKTNAKVIFIELPRQKRGILIRTQNPSSKDSKQRA